MIIINADDWGRSHAETDAALECYERGTITSVTAMVFMADSERAAQIALAKSIPVGLHLNFSESFSGVVRDETLRSNHQRIVRFLTRSKYAHLLYNPFLRSAFRHTFSAQFDEFVRLYGRLPSHFDGHRHMHNCTNMLVDRVIPLGSRVRRTFSFHPGEKSALNRGYRRMVDRRLVSRYRITDFFFALSQNQQPNRLAQVFGLASTAKVELMTHPVVPAERALLATDHFERDLSRVPTTTYHAI
jgi:chitin disaccharide deacetylase